MGKGGEKGGPGRSLYLTYISSTSREFKGSEINTIRDVIQQKVRQIIQQEKVIEIRRFLLQIIQTYPKKFLEYNWVCNRGGFAFVTPFGSFFFF